MFGYDAKNSSTSARRLVNQSAGKIIRIMIAEFRVIFSLIGRSRSTDKPPLPGT
tara:strand:- start:1190 stop:1351 length:162 start_codon:yes stop_codon:yes gene_type:complete